ncbi:MAG TPA: hypothetical protein H9962_07710 [Candidatus Mailhella merdigallinarum]|uniref:Uncharacterized protein n=1 Tax=Candidatus Mailhella merdigallinarum TaxID=2838658 RepID=A0A9D2HDD5_9BACT|nr:hypothetical protein [Candidatus Mailhella merdigallinarum]
MRAADVLRLVSGALQDLEPGLESRWPWEGGNDGRVGLLDFLNDAVWAVALQRPDTTAVTEAILLEPGMRQRLPRRSVNGATRDARFLMELIRNMGPDGEQPGPAIGSVPPELLLAWANTGRTSPVVENFAYDRVTNRDVYYVYPAVPDRPEVWVEATYSAAPEPVAGPDQSFPLSAEYADAVKHHMLASIFSGDNESSNAAKAAWHMQMYASVMGVKQSVDAAWPRARGTGAGA